MDRLKDIKIVYKKALKRTFDIIKKVPFILLIPLIFGTLIGLINSRGNSYPYNYGMLYYLLLGFLEAILLSAYFNILRDAILYKRVNLNSFKSGFLTFAIQIYIVGFVFSLLRMVLGPVFNNFYFAAILFIILNPIGEAIYLGGEGGYTSLPNTFYYFKDNFHLWIPHIIVFLAIYLGLGLFSSILANPLDSYLYPVIYGLNLDYNVIIYLIFRGFYDIFRGVIYIETKDSNMRKRIWRGDLD